MRKKRFSALAVVLSVVLTLVISLGGVALAAWLTIGTQGLTLLEGLALINTRFVGEYEKDGVTDAAMSGMVAGLNDRWSYYLNPESYAANQERRQNQYVGIGVTVSYEDERGLLVTIVNEGGPAEKAGLQAGDIIISAEGTSLAGEARYEGVNLIQGEAGTPVSLGIMAADGTERTVEVAREKLETNPVEYEMLDGNVGYIQVKNFYRRSADGVKAAVDELVGQGAVSLVFDMRNNGGGYLDELTEMLDYLLPEGPIFRSRDRAGNEQVTNSDAHCIDPLWPPWSTRAPTPPRNFSAQSFRSGVWESSWGRRPRERGTPSRPIPSPAGAGWVSPPGPTSPARGPASSAPA